MSGGEPNDVASIYFSTNCRPSAESVTTLLGEAGGCIVNTQLSKLATNGLPTTMAEERVYFANSGRLARINWIMRQAAEAGTLVTLLASTNMLNPCLLSNSCLIPVMTCSKSSSVGCENSREMHTSRPA